MRDPVLVETRTAVMSRGDSGIVVVRIRAAARQSVADARENIDALANLGPGRCALLLDLREAEPLDAETRHMYIGMCFDPFCAFAMVVRAGAFGRMFGNIYLRVAKPQIPTRLFDSFEAAEQWLSTHVNR